MIDLNKQDPGSGADDTPVGVQILVLMPMVWLFWALIEWGLK